MGWGFSKVPQATDLFRVPSGFSGDGDGVPHGAFGAFLSMCRQRLPPSSLLTGMKEDRKE